MNRLERFNELTSTLDAPSIFLEATWLFTTAAALERRVYLGDASRPVHPNIYVLLVGPAGVGKGVAMREARRLLSDFPLFHPDELAKPADQRTPLRDPETNKIREMFHCLPDATTFEQLVFEIADGRKIVLIENGEKVTTCAGYFLLEELSSLIKPKKAEDVARFLLNMFDGEPYKYATRTASTAIIENGCLNLIAGTTPDYLRVAEESNLIGEGLMSRMLLVYAEKSDREAQFFFADLSKEQKDHQAYLRRWLNYLGQIHGRINIDRTDTIRWLESWWRAERERLMDFNDARIEGALQRRKIMTMKLAIAFHFSTCDPKGDIFRITRESFEQSIAFQTRLEPAAIKLLQGVGRNKSYNTQQQFLKWMERNSPVSATAAYDRLAPHLNSAEVSSLLAVLMSNNVIVLADEQLWLIKDGKPFTAADKPKPQDDGPGLIQI